MTPVQTYFPDENPELYEKLEALQAMYVEWNSKVNIISRKDIDNIGINHLVHSLSITHFITFKEGARILDLGTGGGLPGLPLAIYYPEVQFHLIDGTRKKIDVIKDICQRLDIKNVKASHLRVEECKDQYDFVVTRAVAAMDKLYEWSQKRVLKQGVHGIPNGIIALKGGNLDEELKAVAKRTYVDKVSIGKFINHPYFETKYIVYVQV